MNSSVINPDYLKNLNDFGKDLDQHAFIIKFEIITPDMTLLCFRTSGLDGSEHYFAYLQFDHLFSIKHARKVIAKSFSKVIEFVSPIEKQKGRTELEQKSARSSKYVGQALLARVDRPIGNGYWSSYIQIMPGDNINEKLSSLSEKDQDSTKLIVLELMQREVPVGVLDRTSFLSGWQQKSDRMHLTIDDLNTNDTALAMNLFKNILGEWEVFYNRVNK